MFLQFHTPLVYLGYCNYQSILILIKTIKKAAGQRPAVWFQSAISYRVSLNREVAKRPAQAMLLEVVVGFLAAKLPVFICNYQNVQVP